MAQAPAKAARNRSEDACEPPCSDFGSGLTVQHHADIGAAASLLIMGVAPREALVSFPGRLPSAGSGSRTVLGVLMRPVALPILAGLDERVEGALVEASSACLTSFTTHDRSPPKVTLH